ncbi:hypothetical protein [uncultured Microbacterium sp.]|uniref:hypothetical protein n=1 Tax=uncultured Microbacterium sp. TaxID=191216 RepID=UPI00262D6259|nr:hypothetical protein [uncultured Microbacterium sp.]
MKITVDLDPRDIWRIQERAEREGITPGQILRDELTTKRTALERRTRIRARVLAGMCDADIAKELDTTNQHVAAIRRSEGLPANRRNQRRTA